MYWRVSVGSAALAVLMTGPLEQPAHADSTTTIVNEGSGMCVEVAPPVNDPTNFGFNGLNVVQAPCNGSLEQLWDFQFSRLTQFGSLTVPVYHLVNHRSGMCMDLTDGNLTDGTHIQQWTCGTSTTMDWIPNFGSSSFANISSARSLAAFKNQCLDIRGGSLQSGAIVQIYTTTQEPTNTAQRFSYIRP